MRRISASRQPEDIRLDETDNWGKLLDRQHTSSLIYFIKKYFVCKHKI